VQDSNIAWPFLILGVCIMPKNLTKDEFFEKYSDPRWQKKRLEVLERDNWECSYCGDTKNTLHVHHAYYKKGLKPWEYSIESLCCLCEECHQEIRNKQIDLLKLIYELGPQYFDILIGFCYGMLLIDPSPENREFKIKNYPMAEGIFHAWGIPPEELTKSLCDRGIINHEFIAKLSAKTSNDQIRKIRGEAL